VFQFVLCGQAGSSSLQVLPTLNKSFPLVSHKKYGPRKLVSVLFQEFL
jgi:hypothetical protein